MTFFISNALCAPSQTTNRPSATMEIDLCQGRAVPVNQDGPRTRPSHICQLLFDKIIHLTKIRGQKKVGIRMMGKAIPGISAAVCCEIRGIANPQPEAARSTIQPLPIVSRLLACQTHAIQKVSFYDDCGWFLLH